MNPKSHSRHEFGKNQRRRHSRGDDIRNRVHAGRQTTDGNCHGEHPPQDLQSRNRARVRRRRDRRPDDVKRRERRDRRVEVPLPDHPRRKDAVERRRFRRNIDRNREIEERHADDGDPTADREIAKLPPRPGHDGHTQNEQIVEEVDRLRPRQHRNGSIKGAPARARVMRNPESIHCLEGEKPWQKNEKVDR